jgi:hypothetical protein
MYLPTDYIGTPTEVKSSGALWLSDEKINENLKDPGFPPQLGQTLKSSRRTGGTTGTV